MTRNDLLRGFVLEVIADDYEEVDKIYSDVFHLVSRCGMGVQRAEILQALIDLIEFGDAKAYDLSVYPAREVCGVPKTIETRNPYFLITPKGREMHSNGDWWPFDEDGAVRNNWIAPLY